MGIRAILGAGALAAAAVAIPALPAMAFPIPAVTTHTAFIVQDNNGVLYTKQLLTVDQVIHRDGLWYTVRSVRPYGLTGTNWIITLSPHVSAGGQFYT